MNSYQLTRLKNNNKPNNKADITDIPCRRMKVLWAYETVKWDVTEIPYYPV